FSGGASLAAAERVCAGDAVEQEQVLDLLTALTEKSLLVTDADGAPRYRMTGTIKEYAGHRLAEAGETDVARRVHLGFFTELTETAEPHLRRAEQLEWLATLEAEHDNIGSAMRGALAAGEAPAAMRLRAGRPASGGGVDPSGIPVQPAQSVPQPAAGVGRPAGTHAAGAGRVLARVGTVAGQRGSLGTGTGPAPAREDADRAWPWRAGCGRVPRDG